MVSAITVKFFGPGIKGSRYKAISGAGDSVFVEIDHGLTDEKNREAAVRKLCEKIGWEGQLVGGFTKAGWVYVFIDKGEPIIRIPDREANDCEICKRKNCDMRGPNVYNCSFVDETGRYNDIDDVQEEDE